MASDILFDTSIRQHPRLIVQVPNEHENEIRLILETLAQEHISAQMVVLEALRIAAEQTYFWTPEWQARERAADNALATGQFQTFDTMDEMLEFLDQE